ncbi:MAG: hypothetical protein ONB30_03220 [candidate division KSB1 bacterium]|nr:hypothetical protein [candidate division KSB1 bacterium]MDZ7295134.1 hypothetical protein [candidate division KSB1 bacterium]MDZ7337527.1 hypothetical protein [candidate division KSB1 bacterium]MDZ7379701.1 hypothetical protein [candidate division KSB1 bacterium]MDZ7386017.1 hypothetical protein [candidate division KSB1 bacterium]
MSLLVRLCLFLAAMAVVEIAENATALTSLGEEVELTIFYSADICGYLEPCG